MGTHSPGAPRIIQVQHGGDRVDAQAVVNALYEHGDPRQGEHPDWDTLIYDYGRPEVRNYLLASALNWLEEFHVVHPVKDHAQAWA